MEKQLSVLVNTNGSIEILSQNIYSDQQNWIPAIFHLIGFCFGVGLGLITLLGLSAKLCGSPVFALQIAAVFDCIQGQSFGSVFVISQPDECMCRLSASTSAAFLVIETAEMCLLTFPLHSFQIGIIPWIFGIFVGLSIVIDFQNIPISYYPNRYGCSVVNGQHDWFPMIVTFVLATTWLGAASGIIYSAIFKETSTDIIVSRVLSVLYLILVLPTALILIISMSMKPNVTSNNNEYLFTWMRYQFNLLIPVVILLFYKQVRKECEKFLFWCRKNSIDQVSEHNLTNSSMHIPKRIPFTKYQTKISEPITPVLFATSNGLHLRTVSCSVDLAPSIKKDNCSLFCKPCDLTVSRQVTPHEATESQPKYVRFMTPVVLDTPGNSIEFVQINTTISNNTDNKFGFTYTKV